MNNGEINISTGAEEKIRLAAKEFMVGYYRSLRKYHGTTPEAAKSIRENGLMKALQSGGSSEKTGGPSSYGRHYATDEKSTALAFSVFASGERLSSRSKLKVLRVLDPDNNWVKGPNISFEYNRESDVPPQYIRGENGEFSDSLLSIMLENLKNSVPETVNYSLSDVRSIMGEICGKGSESDSDDDTGIDPSEKPMLWKQRLLHMR